MTTIPRSQNHLAELLGISKSVCSAQVKRGMPTDSLESAQAWRRAKLDPARRKSHKPDPTELVESLPLRQARAMMEAASALLKAGGDLEALKPALRGSLAAVPPPERDAIGLDLEVMRHLTAHVLDRHPPTEPDHFASAEMSDEEANEVGQFLYAIAAGEWVLTAPCDGGPV